MTDVTGFGLIGHAHDVGVPQSLTIEIDHHALPDSPGALDYGRARRLLCRRFEQQS